MNNGLHHNSIIIDGLNASYFQDAEVLQRIQRGGVTAVNAAIAAGLSWAFGNMQHWDFYSRNLNR